MPLISGAKCFSSFSARASGATGKRRLFAAAAGEIVSNAALLPRGCANLQPFDLRRHEAAKLYAKPVMDIFARCLFALGL